MGLYNEEFISKYRVMTQKSFGDSTESSRIFRYVDTCSSKDRETQVVVSDLAGTLLRKRNAFVYFMLLAFEVGGFLRAVLLLLFAPLIWTLSNYVSEVAGLKVMIFVALAGLKINRIQTISRAVLPKFCCDDIHPEAFRVFSSFGKRHIVTAIPRIMMEVFAKEYLGADAVIGTELEVTKGGRATGFVKQPGLIGRENKVKALYSVLGEQSPDVCLGRSGIDLAFMSLSKEGYIVPPTEVDALEKDKLPRPVIFHDGRFVQRPDELTATIVLLWFPFGFILAVVRVLITIVLAPLPFSVSAALLRASGVKIKVKGTRPPLPQDGNGGVLFVLSHRTLMDPVMLSLALGRRVAAVTYSISRLSEVLSPIKSVAVTRRRKEDSELIQGLLTKGDLAVCPEGTTCREPFLLRFSALFAELTNEIVPVAMYNKMSMFHGTTATGWKGMDAIFFLMNPRPEYQVTFLQKLPLSLTCAGGNSSHEVANYIQRVIAGALNFECTNLTRKDKYLALARNDGSVAKYSRRSIRRMIKTNAATIIKTVRSGSFKRRAAAN